MSSFKYEKFEKKEDDSTQKFPISPVTLISDFKEPSGNAGKII